MKLTAFYLAGKVEEAARSYFSNSFVFASRKIDVRRVVDFRNRNATIQFYLHDGDEVLPMGSMEFDTVQERDNKTAFQCRYHILPSDEAENFFLILNSDAEQYSQYTSLAEVLRKRWEKNIDSYLPKNEEAPQVSMEEPKSLEDEYDSLTPEEIEAITGERPKPKGEAGEPDSSSLSGIDTASEEEIQKLMGEMMSGGGVPEPAADEPAVMSMEEIEALTKDVQSQASEAAQSETPVDTAKTEPVQNAAPKGPSDQAGEETADAKPAGEKDDGGSAEEKKPKKKWKKSVPKDDGPVEDVSVEDIWKQISGGG